jgi:hypothetical protein
MKLLAPFQKGTLWLLSIFRIYVITITLTAVAGSV